MMIVESATVSGLSGEGKVSIVGNDTQTEQLQAHRLVSKVKGRRGTQQEVKTLVYGTKQAAFSRQTLRKIPGFQHGHTNSWQSIAKLRS